MKSALLAAVLALSAAASAKTVRVSDFGFDPKDATKFLQAALDSDADTVVVDRQASDWVTHPLKIRRKLELVFADGVRLVALRGAFKHKRSFLLTVEGTDGVVLRGEGRATLAMHKPDYLDAKRYAFSEWRHALSLLEATNVTVRCLDLCSSGGDGIYVKGCRDVTVEDVRCLDNDRQGISIISAEGLFVRRCTFAKTAGTAPAAGVDFEPNRPGEPLQRILFEDCVFADNYAAGIQFHLTHSDATTAPVDVTMRRCRSTGNGSYGVRITGYKRTCVPGRILFEDCAIAGGPRGTGSFNSIPASALKVTFRRCAFESVADKPVFAFANAKVMDDLGGFMFEKCTVKTKGAEEIASFIGMIGSGMGDVRGTFPVSRPDGTTAFDLAAFARKYPSDPHVRTFAVRQVDLEKLRPSAPSASAAPAGENWLRGRFTFVQYVPKAGEYSVRFEAKKVGKRNQIDMPVAVRDAVGTDLGAFAITKERQEHRWTAHGPGLHVLEVDTKGSRIRVLSDLPGHGLLADGRLHIIRGVPKFYFHVPSGAKDVSVEVLPDEPASARLLNARGEVVAEKAFDVRGAVLYAKRTKPSAAETWCVDFPKIVDDCELRIGASAIPVVSDRPDPLVEAD